MFLSVYIWNMTISVVKRILDFPENISPVQILSSWSKFYSKTSPAKFAYFGTS